MNVAVNNILLNSQIVTALNRLISTHGGAIDQGSVDEGVSNQIEIKFEHSSCIGFRSNKNIQV